MAGENHPGDRHESHVRLRPPGSPPPWVTPLLKVPSAVYSAAMSIRNYMYDKGILASHRVSAPVISVGNLSVGGTGKTPCVVWLAERLQRWGRCPAIVSRGYHGRYGRHPVRVPPGGDADMYGDEPVLMASGTPEIPVVVSRDRFEGAVWALVHTGADCVVLDDGFQHRRLYRDVNILLAHAAYPLHLDTVLPAGTLREPLPELRRAHAVIFTHTDQYSPSGDDLALVSRFNPRAEIFFASHRFKTYRKIGTSDTVSPSDLPEPAGLISAIGDPEGFRRTAAATGVEICFEMRYPDHRRLDEAAWSALEENVKRKGGKCLVTTAKDEARMNALPPVALPVFVLDVLFDFRDTERFEIWIRRMLKTYHFERNEDVEVYR